MGHLKKGGLLFALTYTLWRGFYRILDIAATLFYRRVIAKTGANTVFQSGVYVSHPWLVEIGKNCYVGRNVILRSEHGTGKLIMKDSVQISDGVLLDFTGGVIVGEGALLSPGVHIETHDHGYDPHSSPTGSSLEIGNRAWIGGSAMILPKVRVIGEGAIIAAGAVVTKPVPPYSIVAGNPARVIKLRQDVQALEASPA